MPTFRVTAVCRTYYECTFEAPNLSKAIEMADEMDGADFTENDSEWETFHLETGRVTEEESEKT